MKINFGFTHMHWCVLALFTQYFAELCENKIPQAYYSGGIRTHDLCHSRAVSCQLSHRDCPVVVYYLKLRKLVVARSKDKIIT